MAPRPSVAGSSKQSKQPFEANGRAGPSRLIATSSKKRGAEEIPTEKEDDDEFGVNGDGLDLSDEGSESDGEYDEDVDGVNGDEEDFPELDSGSEEEEGDDKLKTRQHGGDDTDSEDEPLDDEETGSESGYNSSDIDAMYSSATSHSSSPSSSKQNLSLDEKLSKLIAENSVKPDERIGTDEKVSRAKDGTGKLVPSKLVAGGYKREYDDVEAGYGSESSTEDVSLS